MYHRLHPYLRLLAFFLPFACCLPLTACRRESALTVAAAASLREVFQELGPLYEQQAHRPIRFSFAASGLLKAQIDRGAPYDAFASASLSEVDALQAAGKLAGPPQVFASNRLVLVKSRLEADCGWSALGARRLAIGNPATVPAGRYARQALQALGHWDALAPRLVLSENVRQAVDYLRTGEVDYAIVYATDVRAFRLARCQDFAPGLHQPLRLPVAVIKGSSQLPAAQAWLRFLRSPQAQIVLARHGFGPP